jgi:signal transduction histidine kinase
MLAAMKLQLEIVTSHLSDPPDGIRQALENLSKLAAGALDQVRSVSRRLHPPEWQGLTIEAALSQLWHVSGIPLRYHAHLDLSPLPREPDPEIKALLYRTAQEGLSNIMGHSHAQKVSMSLRDSSDSVVLTLQDDGVGFNTAALSRPLSGGIGLRSLAEQATALGAKFDVDSGSNGTTLVLVTQYLLEF